MKTSTMHNKVLELYVKKGEPDAASIKRSVAGYLRRRYADNKIERIVEDLLNRFDFQKESSDLIRKKQLAGYMDSIIISRIRDSFKSRKQFNIDELEEIEFKALAKQVFLHFGYEVLFDPSSHGNHANNADLIVHRGDKKIAVLAVKSTPGYSVGAKMVKQVKYMAGYYNCEQAALLTNTCFEEEAVKEAWEMGVMLLDGKKIVPLIQDLIDNRQKEEKEYLLSAITGNTGTIFLDGQIKFPKTKVQVVSIKYYIDSRQDTLVFEGELLNNGKRPVVNIAVDIRIFDRAGNSVYWKNTPLGVERMSSKEKTAFKVTFDEIPQEDWKNICKYELKLDYENVYMSE